MADGVGKHSKGALNAAKLIDDFDFASVPPSVELTLAKWAEIISRETHDTELAEALRACLDCELYCACGGGEIEDASGDTHSPKCARIVAEKLLAELA